MRKGVRRPGRRRAAWAASLALGTAAVLASVPTALATRLRFTHPEPDSVSYYRVHFGTASRDYSAVLELGRVPLTSGGTASVEFPVPAGQALYVAMTATRDGRESAYSNELVIAPPGAAGPSDGVAVDGDGSGLVGDGPCRSGETMGCDDNCPLAPNGPQAGSCVTATASRIGRACEADADCGTGGHCSLAQEDRDGDGIGDACDRCVEISDRSQLDADEDGFGNACDADFDGDGLVTPDDLLRLGVAYGRAVGDAGYDALFDADGDGDVDAVDWFLASFQQGRAPGPSALHCDGTPCIPAACPTASMDSDGDGVGDECDVCVAASDPLQFDSDRDGFGDACDLDFDANGTVGLGDFNQLRSAFGAQSGGSRYRSDIDTDGDGVIGLREFNLLRVLFGSTPGESGLDCAGTPGCSDR